MPNISNLLLLFIVPYIASLIAFFVPCKGKVLKGAAVVLSLIPLAILLLGHASWMGMTVQYPWLPMLSIEFTLKVDALSLVFLYLTSIVVPMSLLATRSEQLSSPHVFYGLILLLQGLLIGFFTTRDLAFFTFFWEAMLLPLYFLINLWGGPQRRIASLKFLIYMIAGSALMVAAVLSLYFSSIHSGSSGTFDMGILSSISNTLPHAKWLCAIFLLAFAVKTPLFPFHAWLPDAYCQASTPGTILLSGILSKAGIYGVLRVAMELFPSIMVEWSPILVGFAIAGVFYGGLAAWKQNDYKRLIAYSSFSHVNFVLVGLFMINQSAQAGGLLQALNHGLTITALFLVAGWLEERIGSTTIGRLSGLASYFPQLCWLTLFFVISSIALPGLNNFVGEFLIFYGVFIYSPMLTAFLGLSIILSVMYMLRWMQKMYFEVPTPLPLQSTWSDIKGKQLLIALPLVALLLWIGMYPMPVLNQIKPAVDHIVAITNVEQH